jgi:DedD protein
VIQIAAFAGSDKARGLAERIKAKDYPAYTELVRTAQGDRTRVRAGPFPSQEAARQARGRLKRLGLIPAYSEGRIVRPGQ